eukprot:scaffold224672_cov40-Prasinocladus_malaysianus.AAC.1
MSTCLQKAIEVQEEKHICTSSGEKYLGVPLMALSDGCLWKSCARPRSPSRTEPKSPGLSSMRLASFTSQ